MGQSTEHALIRSLTKRGFSDFVRDDVNYTTKTPISLRIKHVGSAAITSVILTAATNLVLIDADGTTTSTFSTDDTLGKVADRINDAANWECEVLDGLRADASASTMSGTTITAAAVDGVIYYDVEADTSSANIGFTYRCTPNRHVGLGAGKGAQRVHLRQIRYNADLTAAADKVQVWECTPDGRETKVYSALSVDSTGTTNADTSITWGGGYGAITSGDNNALVVRVAGTVVDDADGHLSVIGEYE